MASPSAETREVTLQAWRKRMQRVADWLVDHLDQPFDLDRLAELAHFSPYHFHRVYSVAMGEPVAETVRRMRLHRAAWLHRIKLCLRLRDKQAMAVRRLLGVCFAARMVCRLRSIGSMR